MSYNPGNLSLEERTAILEYKVLALSLHIQRLEAMLNNTISPGNAPSLVQMRERLSEIDGIGGVLPIQLMTETKAREMLGDGPSPHRFKQLQELLKLDI